MIFKKANILLPNVSDYSKWSVVACDQYTSEPEYWNDVKEYIGRSASTLKLVFPEVYLGQGGRKARINRLMKLCKSIWIAENLLNTRTHSF